MLTQPSVIIPPFNRSSALTVQKTSGILNLESDITPEIAAHVVRNYLLPMFESDLKKGQRKKRQSDYNPILSNKVTPRFEDKLSSRSPDPNTVYGELKLSEKLQLEIYALRDDNDNLREHIEGLGL